jgi:hypothetical protein
MIVMRPSMENLAQNPQPVTQQQTAELQRYQKANNTGGGSNPQQQQQQPTKMQPGGQSAGQSLQANFPANSPRNNVVSPRPPSIASNNSQGTLQYNHNLTPNSSSNSSNPNSNNNGNNTSSNLSNSGNASTLKQQYQPPPPSSSSAYQQAMQTNNQRQSTNSISLTDSPRMISPPLTSSQLATSPRITQVQRQPNHHYQHVLKDLNTQLEEGDIM